MVRVHSVFELLKIERQIQSRKALKLETAEREESIAVVEDVVSVENPVVEFDEDEFSWQLFTVGLSSDGADSRAFKIEFLNDRKVTCSMG